MRVSNFSLLVPEGKERDSGHVELPHGATYHIKLGNHCYTRRCDALVSVDGKEIGLFRVERGSTITLETYPGGDRGKFTFFQADSQEAEAAGAAGIAKDVRGLIQVTFKPEKPQEQPVVHTDDWMKAVSTGSILRGAPIKTCSSHHMSRASDLSMGLCSAPRNASAGVTGLTGHSSQTFHEVASLDYDPTEEVVISVRLVCGMAVRPLEAVRKGNPVPEAIA